MDIRGAGISPPTWGLCPLLSLRLRSSLPDFESNLGLVLAPLFSGFLPGFVSGLFSAFLRLSSKIERPRVIVSPLANAALAITVAAVGGVVVGFVIVVVVIWAAASFLFFLIESSMFLTDERISSTVGNSAYIKVIN